MSNFLYYIGGRFVNSPGIIGFGISWVTSSLWDHFEFWFDAEQMALVKSILTKYGMPLGTLDKNGVFTPYSDEGGYVGAHIGDGIQFRSLNYLTVSRERRYKKPITQTEADVVGKTIEEIFEGFVVSVFKRVGTPYATDDIAAIFFHTRKLTPLTREICSEFGLLAPAENGIFFLNCDLEYSPLITPETLHLSNLWMRHCVYSYPPET